MEDATVIAVFFSAVSLAPITMLELGLFARTGKVVVACQKGYPKRGNVQVVCKRFDIPFLETLEDLQATVETKLEVASNSSS